jgi:hypothetical protein
MPINGSAASLVASPAMRRTEQVSSKKVAKYAAQTGLKSGTPYSFSNKAIVVSKFEILVSPLFRKTLATNSRKARSKNG